MPLTPRQREVAELVARGMSYKAVGRELGISHRTVEEYVHDAARRIDANTCRPRDTVTIWFLLIDKDAA